MAKVQQKSEKITAFGGIFFVLDKFDSILSSVSHGARHGVIQKGHKREASPPPGASLFCSPSDLQHGYWSVAHTTRHAQRGTYCRQNRNQNLNQRLPCLFLHNFKF